MSTIYTERYSNHPKDFAAYDTKRIREEFLMETLFVKDSVNLVYSMNDRFISGGCWPVSKAVKLDTIAPLRAEFFLERRELGIINVGGQGIVRTEHGSYTLNFKEALYLGKGTKDVVFESVKEDAPAKFYLNSTPAHKEYPSKLITRAMADKLELGSTSTANSRTINKLLVNSVLDSCQLQMGLTELNEGSIWNTMPAHTHNRRMEVYFYFEVPVDHSVCHFMGQPQETRHVWMQNEQAIISPAWSIHCGAGTSNYSFIWGMAGENLDYSDMDAVAINDLK